MLRPKVWIVGLSTLGFLFTLAVRPQATTAEAGPALPMSVSPTVPLALLGCASVDARAEFEYGDCLQSTRIDLIEGTITLTQAIRRLEACAGDRADLAELVATATAYRSDIYRARSAFGDLSGEAELGEYTILRELLGDDRPAPSIEAVERLRVAGITVLGFRGGAEEATLARLKNEGSLRRDFRAVFGDARADDLEAILARGEGARAVIVGETVIVPNRSLARPGEDGGIIIPDESGDPLAVSLDAYATRVATDLAAFERARLRFLSSSARENRRTGSIAAFATALKNFREEDLEGLELRDQVESDAAMLLARLTNLDRQLGLEPLLYRSAEESVGLAAVIGQECEQIALNRGRWIRTGAGVVAGLVGAAGLVVVTGSTGTLLGGVIIAAALEATAGAYFVARSERIAESSYMARERASAVDAPERRARPPGGSLELADGSAGMGGGEHENWFEDDGILREWEGLGGEGIEDDGGAATESRPRENTIPPVLPPEPEDELRELPPILNTPLLQQLRELTLPEIQERLDEFLARRDPAALASFSEEDVVEELSAQQMIDEAQASLDLWASSRVLAQRFGGFFIQAELERAVPRVRGEVLLRAMGRYIHDRELYAGSRDVDDLRRRVAARLVAHCRTGNPTGDLALRACTDESALSILLIAALRDAGTPVPEGAVIGIQAFDSRFEAVVYSRERNEVYSLTRGSPREGVVAPIYHPAMFYYTYLLTQGIVSPTDVDEHLLVALPDRPMPADLEAEECEQRRGIVGRAVDWLGSMIGVRRLAANDPCRPRNEQVARSNGSQGGERNASLNIPMPPNPLQRSGGGQSGGGARGGGGGGGGQPFADSSEPMGSGSSGQGSSGRADGGEASEGDQQEGGASRGGEGSTAESAENGEDSDLGGAASEASDGQGGAGAGEGREGEGGEGEDPNLLMAAGDASETGAAGSPGESGGYSLGAPTLAEGTNLTDLGREAARLAREYERAPNLRVQPWRLREDEGMMTGSDVRVLYADNERALQRFHEDDLFITLAPAEVEAQRRMLEADTFPVFNAETTCQDAGLPPRRVFRRVATGEAGFRYVYCDHDESMVIFRDRNDANSYAGLAPPDRPLFLARLGAERLARFERTEEVTRLKAFLADPNMLRRHSREEIYAMAKAAGDLLVFQNTLESALVQSMNELGPSAVRSHYYDMHRQVLQAPLFISLAESVYRLNHRLASDPLQSLAWANAQPRLARQGFFDLYHTLGGMMAWPDRWATLQQRYGEGGVAPVDSRTSGTSLDFLQIVSDPVRVQVDWRAERSGAPSIRDTQMQDGAERTTEEMDMPTLSELPDREEETEHLRGGTGGLGLAGEGDSMGPEEGRRPLQMIRIRVVGNDGDPDRPRVPDDNQVRPGGTKGEKRSQTEESASRQEAVLWVSPQTFVEAVLSPWDSRELLPATANRVPPILRFNERLREIFLRDMRARGVYDNRLRTAMGVFSRSGWLEYAEARDALGGEVVSVRATDTGRFSGAYSGNPPINDQDQIRVPNFFTESGVLIPSDLFPAVREHYTRSLLGIFDLSGTRRVPEAASIRTLPVSPTESARNARASLLWSLELIHEQSVATD